MSKKPLKSTLVVGGLTFISRIFGYVRDAVIFIFFGANAGTDAFFVAFRIPNFLRRLFAEGAFSQAFVPVMSEKLHESETAFQRLINHVSGVLALIVLAITIIGVLASPLFIFIFAPGFDDPQQQLLASDMLKITFPYLFFISLTAMSGSILNLKQRFAVPAITPVLLNISLIAAAIWLAPKLDEPVTALAWGVFLAGIAQLVFQIPFLIRARGCPKFKLSGANQGVKQVFTLMLPAIFGSSIVQINLLIDTMIASFLAEGSISWLYISDRFVELPLALFGIATATVILPLLSKQYVTQQSENFSHTMNWAIRLSLVIAIPAMMGLIALASPILSSLVQYREFTPFDTHMASLSLMAYALGLPAFIFIKILAPAFYSRQDTKTPVKIGVIAMLVNIVLNLLFVWLFIHYEITGSHAGLALATSLSAYVNALLLYMMLHRQRAIRFMQSTLSLMSKVFISALIMFYLLNKFVPTVETWAAWETDMRVGSLLGFIALGVLSYSWVLWMFGIKPSQLKLESD